MSPLTEITIFQVKEGVNLDAGAENVDNAKTFQELTKILQAQPGLIRQFYGHQVETPSLFVWLIDWESISDYTTFHGSESEPPSSLKAGLEDLFDLQTLPPVTLLVKVDSTPAANTAMRSGVTEVAFFTFPERPGQATMDAISTGAVESLKMVEDIGKATGSTIGWVVDAEPKGLVTDDKNAVVLYGVFGYKDIETHMIWRETPEGKAAGEASKASMKPSIEVPGVGSETGYFHVHFREVK